MSTFLDRAKDAFNKVKADTKQLADQVSSKFEDEKHSHTHLHHLCHALHHTVHNRYQSFAPPRTQNSAKWFVDGCGYFWALSIALEQAQSQIWIMDWWLSPELYLRRPPSRNEQYRLDRMLQAAAQRGVKVNVMVYKEVENVLTLDSIHTKHALEALHPNIAVFRHPDHNPSGKNLAADFKNLFLSPHDIHTLPQEALNGIYGLSDDVVLYWAHHEKLCLIDGNLAFMGGLDACFGRWDTNQHSIADAHPSNLDDIVFPGQDFNNARVFDFQNVEHWELNKLDRTKESRMGWSDLSICLQGPVVEDLGAHFVQRWNFIYHQKYSVDGKRYMPLSIGTSSAANATYHPDGTNVHFGVTSQKLAGLHAYAKVDDDMPTPSGAFPSDDSVSQQQKFRTPTGFLHNLHSRFRRGFDDAARQRDVSRASGVVGVQLTRSSSRWSHGTSLEHSISNAYIEAIENSQHFIYIENQFFITATGSEQSPIKNKIGAAIVERVIRAAKAGDKYKVIVAMPSVPAFAGDLHAESSLGTLAIMNFQYNSICRGGYSIMDMIKKAGVDPNQYIKFYNLRNYDRINTTATMAKVEQKSGVSYEAARKEHDDLVGAGFDGRGYDGHGENTGGMPGQPNSKYDRYQQAASNTPVSDSKEYDSVASAYMLKGPSIKSIPWAIGNTDEMDAFVSEELYIHTKCLIADDRVVIVGSANLNDRSQLGYHDSEIAVVIEDPTMILSQMNGQPFEASRFAASLRRQLFRKHLGLLVPQDCTRPDTNFTPVSQDPNAYDWGSPEDLMVKDPLSPDFENLWSSTAAKNTMIFEQVFRPVPTNAVRTWADYQAYYGQYFVSPSPPGTKEPRPAPYQYGHVFKKNFPEGPQGVTAVKECLAGVRGSLVDMPLEFLADVRDLVKEGLGYNAITEDIYA